MCVAGEPIYIYIERERERERNNADVQIMRDRKAQGHSVRSARAREWFVLAAMDGDGRRSVRKGTAARPIPPSAAPRRRGCRESATGGAT